MRPHEAPPRREREVKSPSLRSLGHELPSPPPGGPSPGSRGQPPAAVLQPPPHWGSRARRGRPPLLGGLGRASFTRGKSREGLFRVPPTGRTWGTSCRARGGREGAAYCQCASSSPGRATSPPTCPCARSPSPHICPRPERPLLPSTSALVKGVNALKSRKRANDPSREPPAYHLRTDLPLFPNFLRSFRARLSTRVGGASLGPHNPGPRQRSPLHPPWPETGDLEDINWPNRNFVEM